jgi:hypothetical protein
MATTGLQPMPRGAGLSALDGCARWGEPMSRTDWADVRGYALRQTRGRDALRSLAAALPVACAPSLDPPVHSSQIALWRAAACRRCESGSRLSQSMARFLDAAAHHLGLIASPPMTRLGACRAPPHPARDGSPAALRAAINLL